MKVPATIDRLEVEAIIENLKCRDALMGRVLDIQSEGDISYDFLERNAIWMSLRETLDELHRLVYGKDYKVY